MIRGYFSTLYPGGHGKHKSPFEMYMDSSTYEFVIEEGKIVGFGLDFYEPPQSRGRETSIKDSADVWYERI
jgi:hypothetical protein